MQLQGVCREKFSDGQCVLFYCTKKGKITVGNPSIRRYERQSSTKLCANVTEYGGKTYVTYYTEFNRFVNISKLISLVFDVIIAVFGIIMAIISEEKKPYFIVLAVCLVGFVYFLLNAVEENKNSPKDSDVLIKELENRIDAVNNWDK